MTVFLAVSFVLLIFTRPFAVKYVNKGTVKTNVDGLVGKKARVLEEIDNGSGSGTAVLNGQEWTARAVRDDLVIHKGETVIVKEIRGVKPVSYTHLDVYKRQSPRPGSGGGSELC